MNLDLLIMNGYGLYVWSAFVFTLFNFLILYKVTSRQLVKEKAKFARKYESLNSDQVTSARKQSTNRTFVRTVAHKI
mgnify:CR=1 FL=1|tara:strand:- start:336 stop:566 length:231 start_codon:yes stop_codon:yes gene_type:complete